jgi:hypothetical protein
VIPSFCAFLCGGWEVDPRWFASAAHPSAESRSAFVEKGTSYQVVWSTALLFVLVCAIMYFGAVYEEPLMKGMPAYWRYRDGYPQWRGIKRWHVRMLEWAAFPCVQFLYFMCLFDSSDRSALSWSPPSVLREWYLSVKVTGRLYQYDKGYNSSEEPRISSLRHFLLFKHVKMILLSFSS